MILLRGTLLLALTLPLSALADAESARSWLNRMSQAVHTLNYEGVFVYQQDDGSLQTMQIFHGAGPQGERERLVSLNGSSREVFRDNNQVTCILPDSKGVVVDSAGGRSFSLGFPSNFEQLEGHYAASVDGSERIAGLKAQRISLVPRDAHRYGHVVWVDEATGLLLKSELHNEHGQTVEQLMFTSITLHPDGLPAELLQPRNGRMAAQPAPQARDEELAVGSSRWRVTALPDGFREDLHRHHRLPALQIPVEHFVFSDGLASVSVFIEQEGSELSGYVGNLRKGAVNAYTRLVDGHRVTVLGEVPEATVRLIGDSIRQMEE